MCNDEFRQLSVWHSRILVMLDLQTNNLGVLELLLPAFFVEVAIDIIINRL